LPPDFHLREFSVTKDMESLVQLEKDIHAADTTSRVNFNTDAAVESMKNYYRRAASDNGVFVLVEGLQLIGVVGFMNDGKNQSCAQISSVGLALNVQGKGLFFPFLLAALEISPFKDRCFLNGVTTTQRVIATAEKYGAKTLGYSLSKRS